MSGVNLSRPTLRPLRELRRLETLQKEGTEARAPRDPFAGLEEEW